MGRIIPYIMENKTCSKPPTRLVLPIYNLRYGTYYTFYIRYTYVFQPIRLTWFSTTHWETPRFLGKKISSAVKRSENAMEIHGFPESS